MKAKIRKKKYNDRELEKLWDEFEDVTMVDDENFIYDERQAAYVLKEDLKGRKEE